MTLRTKLSPILYGALFVFIGVIFLSYANITRADDDISSTDVSVTPSTTQEEDSISTDITNTASTSEETIPQPLESSSAPVDASSTTDLSEEASSTSPLPVTGTATITVRDGSVLAWTGTVSFPIGTSTSSVRPTNSSSDVPVLDQSLLGTLLRLENSETNFTISDLAYYPSFGEFLVNCVTIPTTGNTPDCYSWQYQVNGTYPYSGIDQYVLQNGDNVYFYFGNPREVVTATSTVATGESFVATAESYDPATNAYVPLTNYTIGVTQPNPNDPYSPTEIATSSVDSSGHATFTILTPGTYNLGLSEDYYSTLTPIIIASTTTSTSSSVNSNTSTGTSSAGAGGNTAPSHGNVAAAFTFLASQQGADGSFASSDSGITDWIALALALPDAPQGARTKLASYLSTTRASLSSTLDYERHALALEALKINPYSGSPVNAIAPIVSVFSGPTASAQSANTTMFALITLTHAGYSAANPLIQKISAQLVGQQSSNGSWFGGDTDLTAAAIQALAPLQGTSGSVSKAEGFLRSQQNSTGGFRNSDSTSWVLNALAALGETPTGWSLGSSTPLTALAAYQQTDGSNRNPSDTNQASWTWSTAYALTAYEGRSWSSLLGNFSIPLETATTSLPGVASGNSTASSTEATSTLMTIATSTPFQISTTTLPALPFKILPATEKKTSVVLRPTNKALVVQSRILPGNLTAGTANAPIADSFWKMLRGIFATLGNFFKHLL